MNQFHELALRAALRRMDFDLFAPSLSKPLLEQVAIFEIDRHVNLDGYKRRIDVVLLHHRLKELTGVKILLVFPK